MVIKEIEVKNIMTKTNLPVSDFAVNPYVGCTHTCNYIVMPLSWRGLPIIRSRGASLLMSRAGRRSTSPENMSVKKPSSVPWQILTGRWKRSRFPESLQKETNDLRKRLWKNWYCISTARAAAPGRANTISRCFLNARISTLPSWTAACNLEQWKRVWPCSLKTHSGLASLSVSRTESCLSVNYHVNDITDICRLLYKVKRKRW